MNFRASARAAMRALRANKLRSTLTMLGIIMGVADVIATVAVGAGAQAKVTEQIQNLGSNMIIVLSNSIRTAGVRLGRGTQLSITEDDAWAIQREIPSVRAAAPSVRGTSQVVYSNLNWSTYVQGVTPEYFDVREWPIASGRGFTQEDLTRATKVVLLGQTVAETLFGDTDPLNETVRIRRVPFTVIGVLERKGQNPQGQDQDDIVLIPLSTAKTKVLGGRQVNSRSVGAIQVAVRDVEDMREAEGQIRALLRQRHRLQAHQEDDFWLRNLSEVVQAREETTRILTVLLASLASVALLIGGVGIMNIMLVSVTERTREIGLRMAVGARRRDILTQFLLEAITLSVIGGVIGIGVGIAGSSAIANSFEQFPTVVHAESILIAFGFAAAIGVFFGFYPARKASRLDPIEALRYE
jgi:putative ABC transport system permease protein